MVGRKPKIENEYVLSKVLSIWEAKGKDALAFKEIHEELVRSKIVSKPQNRMTTYRILKKLEELGFIEKKGKLWVLAKKPPPFSAIAYALEKTKERAYEINVDIARLLIGGFNLKKLGIKKLDEEAIKKIEEWADWTYYVLIKGKWGDAPEKKAPESLYFVLGLIVGAFDALYARFLDYRQKGAIVVTPAPRTISLFYEVMESLERVKGPYTLAEALAELEPEKARIIFEAPWLKERFGKETVELAKTLYPTFRKFNEYINLLVEVVGESESVKAWRRKLFEEASKDPYTLGKIVGLKETVGYRWFLEKIKNEYGFIPNDVWLKEFEKGFREGKDIARKLREEEGFEKPYMPSRIDVLKIIVFDMKDMFKKYRGYREYAEYVNRSMDSFFEVVRKFKVSPYNAIWDAIHTGVLYDAPEETLREKAKEHGISDEWLNEFIQYLRLVRISEILGDFASALAKGDSLDEEVFKQLKKEMKWFRNKFTYEEAAKALGFWEPVGIRLYLAKAKGSILDVLKEIYGESISQEKVLKAFEEGRKLAEKHAVRREESKFSSAKRVLDHLKEKIEKENA